MIIKDFLLNRYDYCLVSIFSIYHIILLLITLTIILYIVKNKSTIKNLNIVQVKKMRIILASLLIINVVLRRGSFIIFGYYDWHYHLDINFCNFTSILFIIYSLTGSKKIYNYCYYMAFIGPLLSIILPSGDLYLTNYAFYSFLVLHYVIFIFNIVFMYIEDKSYNRRDFIKAQIFIYFYLFVTYIFDFITKTTYNMPLTFINEKFFELSSFQKLSNNCLASFAILVGIVELLLWLGKIIIKKK